MAYSIRVAHPADTAACSAINRALPDWFGLEEGLQEADGYLRQHDCLVAEEGGAIVGYLTWAQLFPESAEISWMAVAPNHHRRGVGRALVAGLVQRLNHTETRLLSVKTLADTHPSPEYAMTRAFYMAMGFHRQMVLPDLWGPSNPCLLMVKPL